MTSTITHSNKENNSHSLQQKILLIAFKMNNLWFLKHKNMSNIDIPALNVLYPLFLQRSLTSRLRKGCWVTWTISCHSSWAKMAATVQSLIHFWKNFDLPQLQGGNFSSFYPFILIMNIWSRFSMILVGESCQEPVLTSEKNIDRLSADIDASLNPLVELKEE